TANTFILTSDASAPTTTVSLAGTAGVGDWYVSPVTVTLSATDPDGQSDVASTFYTVDGGAQQTYTSAFTISADGVHTVTFWSVDQAGNVETASSIEIDVDQTNPTVAFGAASPAANAAGWNNLAVSVPFTAADATSGVASASDSPVVLSTEGTAV